jgi:hypothetical protein
VQNPTAGKIFAVGVDLASPSASDSRAISKNAIYKRELAKQILSDLLGYIA